MVSPTSICRTPRSGGARSRVDRIAISSACFMSRRYIDIESSWREPAAFRVVEFTMFHYVFASFSIYELSAARYFATCPALVRCTHVS